MFGPMPFQRLLFQHRTPCRSSCQPFAAGIGKASTKGEFCEKIISWLVNAEDVIIVTEKLGYGYLFMSQNKFENEANRESLLWVNDKYLSDEKQTELVEKWLQNVRFADK